MVNIIDISVLVCYTAFTLWGKRVYMISEEKLYTALGARLKKLREGEDGSSRLTQAELATKVGLERTSITNIEKGNQKVPLHVLYRLCEVLKVDISSVLPALAEVQDDDRVRREVKVGNVEAKLLPLTAQVVENLFSSTAVNREQK